MHQGVFVNHAGTPRDRSDWRLRAPCSRLIKNVPSACACAATAAEHVQQRIYVYEQPLIVSLLHLLKMSFSVPLDLRLRGRTMQAPRTHAGAAAQAVQPAKRMLAAALYQRGRQPCAVHCAAGVPQALTILCPWCRAAWRKSTTTSLSVRGSAQRKLRVGHSVRLLPSSRVGVF